jgi:hypothetical protein
MGENKSPRCRFKSADQQKEALNSELLKMEERYHVPEIEMVASALTEGVRCPGGALDAITARNRFLRGKVQEVGSEHLTASEGQS